MRIMARKKVETPKNAKTLPLAKFDVECTMTMKGGNTDELYKNDGRLKMAESLREQHPDVTKVTRKWGRWQHHVDYSPFKKNRFIPKPGFVEPTEANNYGMELEILDQVTVNAES